eukprot:3293016-Pyramimonas_sp.AAC.1
MELIFLESRVHLSPRRQYPLRGNGLASARARAKKKKKVRVRMLGAHAKREARDGARDDELHHSYVQRLATAGAPRRVPFAVPCVLPRVDRATSRLKTCCLKPCDATACGGCLLDVCDSSDKCKHAQVQARVQSNEETNEEAAFFSHRPCMVGTDKADCFGVSGEVLTDLEQLPGQELQPVPVGALRHPVVLVRVPHLKGGSHAWDRIVVASLDADISSDHGELTRMYKSDKSEDK